MDDSPLASSLNSLFCADGCAPTWFGWWLVAWYDTLVKSPMLIISFTVKPVNPTAMTVRMRYIQ
jgi:hypothetical protein